ncbi:MAG TPA: hypothetical protein VLM75_03090 [Spirochaetota bacterium]|nr:hypothetical protein [Spirochaetota bacterium]
MNLFELISLVSLLYLPGAAFTVIAFAGNLLITGYHCLDGF